jgi:Zn-dependent protease
MKGMPRNAYVEALVGIGGPLLGTAGAAVCLIVALTTQSQFWFALASTGFLINLFNMIPISPLDGGRIAGAIARWFWAIGYAIGIAVFFVTWSPILLLILILGLFTAWGALRHPRPGYYDVPSHRRLAMGAAYFALMGAMALGRWVADAPLAGIRDGRIEEQAALLGLLHLLRRDDDLPLR